jgi:uncharacterized protein (TIGR03437 family)
VRNPISSFHKGLSALLLAVAGAMGSYAQTFTTVVTFIGTNGVQPQSILQGTDGNFYGTTFGSPTATTQQYGTVFKLTPNGALTTLYSFCSQGQMPCSDGSYPGGIVQGSDGNFYGTTTNYGAGDGSIFKITPAGVLTTLHTFNGTDGSYPRGTLVQGSDGSLYGTTVNGGVNDTGTIFKITPSGALTTIYSFGHIPPSGQNPGGGLVQGSDGNFYGTTQFGGTGGNGIIYKVTPSGTVTSLYNFAITEPAQPIAALIQGTDGNFYGTTSMGGGYGQGSIFKITPSGAFTNLYSFGLTPTFSDGTTPSAALVQGSDGNLYGTTEYGGINGGDGTIFQITTSGTLKTIYTFTGSEGEYPTDLIQGGDGSLYGIATGGGSKLFGSIFKLALGSSTTTPPSFTGVTNGASFQTGIAPNSWITIFGTSLASVTDSWSNAIVNGALPTALDGVKVTVGGQPAYISFVSPTQINALAPNLGAGPASVTVTNEAGTSSAITTTVVSAEPAFFQWGNYAVATTQTYSLAVKNGTFAGVTTTPAKPGDVIILWGTGFGPTTPSPPVGVEVPSTSTYNAAPVTVTMGGISATVYGAALAPGFAGLYQVAIQIPPSLTNGDYPVVATVSGAQSPASTLITVQP